MKALPNDLKSRVNRLAHAEALAHEAAVKARLLADLERLQASGATTAEMLEHLEQQAHIEGPEDPAAVSDMLGLKVWKPTRA